MNKYITLFLGAVCAVTMVSCDSDDTDDNVVMPPSSVEISGFNPDDFDHIDGLYLLNQGNMGANKCSLDFLDFDNGLYARDYYSWANPDVALGLGDVGNDIAIDGGRLYIVVNGSNKVEVMDARTMVRIGQIDVTAPRFITFDGRGNAYVSSYFGSADGKGAVVRFDTRTLAVTGSVAVGLQPEQMAVVDGKLYVANSVAYAADRTPTYDNTVSVVDLGAFKVTGSIEVAPNMYHLRADRQGRLWISSRGDYISVPSRLYCVTLGATPQVKEIAVACSDFAIGRDRLYTYSTEWSAVTSSNTTTYATVSLADGSVGASFISEADAASIATPYAIFTDPDMTHLFMTDARNYVSSGSLMCFTTAGRKLWQQTTGDIPCAGVFLRD